MLLIYFSIAKNVGIVETSPFRGEASPPQVICAVTRRKATWCYVDLFEQDIHMGDLSITDAFSYSNLVRQKNTSDI